MLSLLIAIPPVWDTFIHLWRVEFVASVFLAVTLISAFMFRKELNTSLDYISDAETKLIVLLPIPVGRHFGETAKARLALA